MPRELGFTRLTMSNAHLSSDAGSVITGLSEQLEQELDFLADSKTLLLNRFVIKGPLERRRGGALLPSCPSAPRCILRALTGLC